MANPFVYGLVSGMAPPPPNNQNVDMDLPRTQTVFDADEFDGTIRHQGLPFIHYRAMRCPVGLNSKTDIRHSGGNHNCANGMIYVESGVFSGIFAANARHKADSALGTASDAYASLTVPRIYDDTRIPLHLNEGDRLYMRNPAIVVPMKELVQRQGDEDKLQMPPEHVFVLVDNKGLSWQQGKDFIITDNKRIRWISEGPSSAEGPAIYSIAYLYRPYWYVRDFEHEIRVALATDPETGEASVMRMPSRVTLQREYLYENETMITDTDNALARPTDRAPAPNPQFNFSRR